MKTRQCAFCCMAVWLAAMVFAANCFGAVSGDADGSGNVDLQDVITAIQVCVGMKPANLNPEKESHCHDFTLTKIRWL
ncbi:hypothetical protein [Desulfonema magnum]|uniref:hypothetical protein n=1 Tax=Desulfonema magnum TaxID=45655 RepID=UPI001A9AFC0D|nr:hypothetical protein [Desulfonema magnum]